jgi:uncharacterized membrane protein
MIKPRIFTLSKASLVLLAALASLLAYPSLPEVMPIHWNFEGQPDNYWPKLGGLILIPALIAVLAILFPLLKKIDPREKRYQEFAKVWQIFQLAIIGFLSYVHLINIFVTLNPQYNINTLMLIGLGILLLIIGNYLSKIRQNYFIGIKTPWTIDSEEVWNKTHRLGGILFFLAGIVFILEAIFKWQLLIVTLSAIAIAALVPIVYSYWKFHQLKRV